MKPFRLLALALVLCACKPKAEATEPTDDPVVAVEPLSLVAFDGVDFYDGYAGLVDEPVPDGVQRLRNDLITRRLEIEELDAIFDSLLLDVEIRALCDNYDRIGNVSLALVPPGSTTYVPAEVQRIELGRFITPFMNKNQEPKSVPYRFDVSYLTSAFADPALREAYDLWIELEVFGVPYAANTEIRGCEDRNDVFRGTLTLTSERGTPQVAYDALLPLLHKHSVNNYQEGASDALGTTRKTVPFTLGADVSDAQAVLIVSNHGANAGGEEYERREHFVTIDGAPLLDFVPGRESCEPFREYNTQSNGIYGRDPRSDEEWQSFSNWCPGDVIDTRVMPLGALSAGVHELVVDVPDAEFVDGQGYFPLSIYVQTVD